MTVPLPDGLSAQCSEILASRPAPALLALVVMGKVSPCQLVTIRHLSDALDALYDDAEAAAIDRHAATIALMTNDLAVAQMRERQRRRRVA